MTRFTPKNERARLVELAQALYPDAYARVLAACSDETGGIDRELHAARIVLRQVTVLCRDGSTSGRGGLYDLCRQPLSPLSYRRSRGVVAPCRDGAFTATTPCRLYGGDALLTKSLITGGIVLPNSERTPRWEPSRNWDWSTARTTGRTDCAAANVGSPSDKASVSQRSCTPSRMTCRYASWSVSPALSLRRVVPDRRARFVLTAHGGLT